MQVAKLHKYFDELQLKYGDKGLDAVYGAGCTKNPDICFVFMNPTGKNIATQKEWKGLKAQWLGTKNIWSFLLRMGLFDKKLFEDIKSRKPEDWDYNFAKKVYNEVKRNKIYITNLSKATQVDARPLKNSDFFEYVDLLKQEIAQIKPKTIVTFGNQVSSILLDTNIQVSQVRKKSFPLEAGRKEYKTFPVFYPVGQGMSNIGKSIEDVKWILKSNK